MKKKWAMRLCVHMFFLPATLVVVLTTSVAAQDLGSTGVSVLTWQQDAKALSLCSGCVYRTGTNLAESGITYSNISKSSFGQICYYPLDGQVYGQPLVVTGVKFNNGAARTVVYVVTQNATVYAFDGSPSKTTTSPSQCSAPARSPSEPARQQLCRSAHYVACELRQHWRGQVPDNRS